MFCIHIVAALVPAVVSALDIVTKSFKFAPCALEFTITSDSVPVVPFVAEKVTPVLHLDHLLIGVTSLNV